MYYSHALTPPPTPTKKITTSKRHSLQRRSVIISKNKTSGRRQSLRSNFKNEIATRLDVCNKKLYSHSENIIKINTNANTKPKPLKPPKITLYDTKYFHSQYNTNAFNTSDTEDCNGESPVLSPSSLCVTLYPYETEAINDKHFTKTNGTPPRNHPIKFHDQLEGSPSDSCPIPVATAKLFSNSLPKIEHIKQLSIIDSNNNFASPDTPNDTPTTVVRSIISFPDIQTFKRDQSKHVPPPQKQKYNLYKLFGNVKLPVNWD